MNIRIAVCALLFAGCPSEDVQVFDPEPRQMPQTVQVTVEPVGAWQTGLPGFAVLASQGTRLKARYALTGAPELLQPAPVDCWGPACVPVPCKANGGGFTCGIECPRFVDFSFSHSLDQVDGMADPSPRAVIEGAWLVCRYPLSGETSLVQDVTAI